MARPRFDRKMVLSLDEETYQVLNELGEVSEKPAAAMVREILQAAIPQLKQTIKMLRQIKAGALTEALETSFEAQQQVQMSLLEGQGKFADDVKEVRAKKGRKND